MKSSEPEVTGGVFCEEGKVGGLVVNTDQNSAGGEGEGGGLVR